MPFVFDLKKTKKKPRTKKATNGKRRQPEQQNNPKPTKNTTKKAKTTKTTKTTKSTPAISKVFMNFVSTYDAKDPIIHKYVSQYNNRSQENPKEFNKYQKELLHSLKVELGLETHYMHVNPDVCIDCNVNMVNVPSESIMYCPLCCVSQTYIDSAVCNVAYGCEVDYSSVSYKRIHHLKERLYHLQSRKKTQVSNEVMNTVMLYLLDNGYTDVDKLSFMDVKYALKRTSLNNYYDDTMQIWSRLVGRKPVSLPPIVEELFEIMFSMIEHPFTQVCPNVRKNFLSYNYCLYKFSQLLGRHDLLPYFNLLKSEKKLQEQEYIFAKICGVLEWPVVWINEPVLSV